jgi:hypothetical protein
VTWIGPTRGEQRPVDDSRERATAVATPHSIERERGELSGHGHGQRPVLPVDLDQPEGRAERLVPRPAARHDSPIGVGRVADVEDRGRQLPRLVLGRPSARSPRRRPSQIGTTGPSRRQRTVRGARGGREPDGGDGHQPGGRAGPGQRPELRHAAVQELPDLRLGTNFDYSFRAGLFAGDYSGNTAGPKNPNGDEKGGEKTYAVYTDARNGRGSRRAEPTCSPAGTRSASSRTCSSASTARMRAATERRGTRRTASTSSHRHGLPAGSQAGQVGRSARRTSKGRLRAALLLVPRDRRPAISGPRFARVAARDTHGSCGRNRPAVSPIRGGVS